MMTTMPTDKSATLSYLKASTRDTANAFKTIGDILRHNANRFGEQEAMVFASQVKYGVRHVVTWLELYRNSENVAKVLINLGIRKGDIVAINIRPCPEWLYICFGAILAGAIAAGIAFTYIDGSDIVEMMTKLKTCTFLVLDPGTDGQNWAILKQLLQGQIADGRVKSKLLPSLKFVFGHGFATNPPELRQIKDILRFPCNAATLPPQKPDDVVILFQTSGSTGVPKLVAHSHTSLLGWQSFTNVDFFSENFIVFNDRPFNWIGGFAFTALFGQKRVTMCGFEKPASDPVARMIEVIEEEHCTLVLALPPRIHEMCCKKHNLPADWPVELIVTGGQPISKDPLKALGNICNRFSNSYGATEFFIATQNNVSDKKQFAEYSCGNIMNGSGIEMKVADENGTTLPVNTQGELYIKSFMMFKGYFNDPDKTATVFTADGWYKTDDIARISEDGVLYVTGRKSNVIVSGGMNVAPEILEAVLKSCQGVSEAVIVPVPDPVYNEVLCACIIVKPDRNVSEESLRHFCEHIHNDKPRLFTVLPQFYLFFESFPLTNSGKYARNQLKEIARTKFGVSV